MGQRGKKWDSSKFWTKNRTLKVGQLVSMRMTYTRHNINIVTMTAPCTWCRLVAYIHCNIRNSSKTHLCFSVFVYSTPYLQAASYLYVYGYHQSPQLQPWISLPCMGYCPFLATVTARDGLRLFDFNYPKEHFNNIIYTVTVTAPYMSCCNMHVLIILLAAAIDDSHMDIASFSKLIAMSNMHTYKLWHAQHALLLACFWL